jgi:hypothetical protein
MANETTSTTVTELVRQAAYASGALYFSTKPGVSNFVAKLDITGQPTLTARFPIYDSVTATAIAENTDFTTNSAVDTSGSVDVTVSEHAIRFIITTLSLNATVEDMLAPIPSPALAASANAQGGVVGEMIAEAIQTRQDKDITALFASFDSSTGSNSGAITTTLFQSAITTLDSNNIPSLPRVAVLHPFQWGSLRVAFTNASTYGMQVGEDVVRRGVTASVLGVDIFTTGNVGTATVSTSTVYAGAMFHPSAVALATKGALPEIASEYDASLRAVEVVGTGVWGEAEYRGGATTNGRGGAAVFLYSNSTVA